MSNLNSADVASKKPRLIRDAIIFTFAYKSYAVNGELFAIYNLSVIYSDFILPATA